MNQLQLIHGPEFVAFGGVLGAPDLVAKAPFSQGVQILGLPNASCKLIPPKKEVFYVRDIKVPPAPPGKKWIFSRFRRVKNSERLLDAWEYGYKAWPMLVNA